MILEVAQICLGLKLMDKWNATKLLKSMGWLSLEQLLCVSSVRISHNIIHKNRPTLLAHKMKPKMDQNKKTWNQIIW